jgi:hypothetical protein
MRRGHCSWKSWLRGNFQDTGGLGRDNGDDISRFFWGMSLARRLLDRRNIYALHELLLASKIVTR